MGRDYNLEGKSLTNRKELKEENKFFSSPLPCIACPEKQSLISRLGRYFHKIKHSVTQYHVVVSLGVHHLSAFPVSLSYFPLLSPLLPRIILLNTVLTRKTLFQALFLKKLSLKQLVSEMAPESGPLGK